MLCGECRQTTFPHFSAMRVVLVLVLAAVVTAAAGGGKKGGAAKSGGAKKDVKEAKPVDVIV